MWAGAEVKQEGTFKVVPVLPFPVNADERPVSKTDWERDLMSTLTVHSK